MPGVFAGTLNSGHTLVPVKHKARVAEAAFCASGRAVGAGALTVAIWVGAGRRARGKAVGVDAVGGAPHTYEEEERQVTGGDQRRLKKQKLRRAGWAEQQEAESVHSLSSSQQLSTEGVLRATPLERKMDLPRDCGSLT